MNITYSESIAKIKAMREQASALAKDYMTNSAKEVFDKFPKLEAFRWTQYTPYFNDGDECVFSSRADDATLKYEGYKDSEDEEGFCEAYSYKGCDTPQEVQDAKNFISEKFKIVEAEDFKSVFGDHVQVTATRDGFDVEEYQHD